MKAWILFVIAFSCLGCATTHSPSPVPHNVPPEIAAIWRKEIPSLDFSRTPWADVVLVLDDFAMGFSNGKVRVNAEPGEHGGSPDVTYRAKYISFGEAIEILPQLTYNKYRINGNTIQFYPLGGIRGNSNTPSDRTR
jgi:hypothetical protein